MSRSTSPLSRSNTTPHENAKSFPRSRSRSPPRDWNESHPPNISREEDMGQNGPNRENPSPSSCLGCFGLSTRTRQVDLEELFAGYGRIEKVHLIIDRRTGDSRGFGFIYFQHVEDATFAREKMNGTEVDGRHIRVDFSTTSKPHDATPGRYMGKRRTPPPMSHYDRHDQPPIHDRYPPGRGYDRFEEMNYSERPRYRPPYPYERDRRRDSFRERPRERSRSRDRYAYRERDYEREGNHRSIGDKSRRRPRSISYSPPPRYSR